LRATKQAIKPHTRAEAEFANAFAHALVHATAVVAANPGVSVAPGSLAARVQQAYSRFRPDRHAAIRERALARLSAPVDQRRRDFGAYAERGAEAWAHAEPGLDQELKSLLRTAVRARLDAERRDLAEDLAPGVATDVHGPVPAAHTTLEVGAFSGDVQAGWTTQTIHVPIELQFRWQTNAANAERGVWQLFRVGQSGQQEILLDVGKAGDAPGAIFTIDFSKYLTPKPPGVPATYRVRVIPGTKPKTLQGAGGVVLPLPGKAVAKPSNDVVITYAAGASPGVEFQIFETFQTAWFDLHSIRLVEDQIGPGAEEFHVAGFVQESLPISSAQTGKQSRFGPFYAELDPDGPTIKDLPHVTSFFLHKPLSAEWPRAYTVVVSIVEEDDGGSLSEWQSDVWTIAEDTASGEISQLVREYLEEQFKEYVGENIGAVVQAGAQLAQIIVSLVSSVTAGIVGMVVAAAAFVISGIISGMSDDYYGTEVFVLTLPTNITDYIRTLPGQAMPGGGFRLDTEYLDFRGYTSWPEAGTWDGVVRVSFHWEFTEIYVS